MADTKQPGTTNNPNGNPRWVKGMASPNPGGKPKGISEVRKLALQYCPEGIKALVKMAKDPDTKDADKIQAWKIVLERGMGPPTAPPEEVDPSQTTGNISITFHTTPQAEPTST